MPIVEFAMAPSLALALAWTDVVVVARPTGEVRREEESGLPVAFYTMERETVLRGDIPPSFQVKLYGGESKELSPSGEPRYILIPGSPPFSPTLSELMLLRKSSDDAYATVDLSARFALSDGRAVASTASVEHPGYDALPEERRKNVQEFLPREPTAVAAALTGETLTAVSEMLPPVLPPPTPGTPPQRSTSTSR